MEITIISDYGIENWLIFIFTVFQLLFWGYIYLQLKDFKYAASEAIKSITKIIMRVIAMMWIILTHYIIISTLLISSYTQFLPDKVLLYSIAYGVTGTVTSILIILNVLKYGYKVSRLQDVIKDIYKEVLKR